MVTPINLDKSQDKELRSGPCRISGLGDSRTTLEATSCYRRAGCQEANLLRTFGGASANHCLEGVSAFTAGKTLYFNVRLSFPTYKGRVAPD